MIRSRGIALFKLKVINYIYLEANEKRRRLNDSLFNSQKAWFIRKSRTKNYLRYK